MKRTPLTRLTPLRRTPLARSSRLSREGRLPRRSPKRAKQEAQYAKTRAMFLADNPWCQFPLGCRQRATEIQHRRGRRGARLLDDYWWAASCHEHNIRAETHTAEALACGWLVRIEGKDAA